MGTIVYRATKEQVVRDELANIDFGARVLEHRVIGRKLWFLAEQRSGERAGTKWIGLTLIDCRGGEAAVKCMDEGCGPCYYDCPLSFLDRADPPVGPYAGPWREQVRAFHAQRRLRRRAIGAGTRVALGLYTYVLLRSLGRSGWEVLRQSESQSQNGVDGGVFRMTTRQLGWARLLPSEADLAATAAAACSQEAARAVVARLPVPPACVACTSPAEGSP
jgi:hypothetical protein